MTVPPSPFDGDRFAIIPEPLLFDRTISDRAVRLYGVLCRFAGDKGAFPSRQTLASKLGCSRDSVDRALKELVAARWVSVKARWTDATKTERTTNAYRLNAVVRHPGRTDAATPGREGAAENENEVSNEKKKAAGKPAAPSDADAPKVQPLLVYWIDVVTETTGVKPDKTEVQEGAGIIKHVLGLGFSERVVKAALLWHGENGKTLKWLKSTCREVAAEWAENKPRRSA